MLNIYNLSAAVLALGVGVTGTGILSLSSVSAQQQTQQQNQQQVAGYPDVSPDYWASPFIDNLTQRDMVEGYPDGTFRPQDLVERDEFAAMLRRAFSTDQERQIDGAASRFEDVSEDYWATQPIEESYEEGFMDSPQEQRFLPDGNVSKASALEILSRGLGLSYQPVAQDPTAAAPVQQQPQQADRRNLIPQLPFQALMSPLMAAQQPGRGTQPGRDTQPTAAATQDGLSPREYLQQHYEDADQVSDDAVEQVAAATQSGIVVNHPNSNQLNPNEPINRAEATALIHQTLARQGRVDQVADGTQAEQYVVQPLEQRNTNNQAAR